MLRLGAITSILLLNWTCASPRMPSDVAELQSSRSGTYYIANQLPPSAIDRTRADFIAANSDEALKVTDATVDSIGGLITSGQFNSANTWNSSEAMLAALKTFVQKNCAFFSFREDECLNMQVDEPMSMSDKVSLIASTARHHAHLQQVAQASLKARVDFAVKDNTVRSFVVPSRMSAINVDHLHTDQIIPANISDIRQSLSRVELSYTNFGGQTISVGPILPAMVKSSQLSLHTRRINLDQLWVGIVYEAEILHEGLTWKAFISAETRDPLWIDQQFY